MRKIIPVVNLIKLMELILRTSYFLCALFTVTSLLSSCAQQKQKDSIGSVLIGNLKKNVPYYSISYTRSFAERFSLPVDKASALGKGQGAIAIEIKQINNRFDCKIHLYIDSNLKLYSPHEGNFSEKTMAEYFFINKLTEDDRTYNNTRLDSLFNRAIYRHASVQATKNGAVQTLEYQRYEKEFLPGISLISTDVFCSMLNSSFGDAEILIQKNTVKDYRLGLEDPSDIKFPENSYSFMIPNKLLTHVKPYVEYAREENRKNSYSNVISFGETDPVVEIP